MWDAPEDSYNEDMAKAIAACYRGITAMPTAAEGHRGSRARLPSIQPDYRGGGIMRKGRVPRSCPNCGSVNRDWRNTGWTSKCAHPWHDEEGNDG